MVDVIAVRCQNGVVVWGRVSTGPHRYNWICGRDGFLVAQPTSVEDAERVLISIAQHSVVLAGAILQVVQVRV